MINFLKKKIKINKNELSGSFGDIGTDLPLIIGMLAASNLESSNVLITFGIMQILTALLYGIPMPVQPLKAVAAIVIVQKISSDIIFNAGLLIGLIMLILTLTGALTLLAKIIPKTVIRGIQFGLGLKLSLIALKNYIPYNGYQGYTISIIAFIIGISLIGNKKYPPAIFIILFGFLYALLFNQVFFDTIKYTTPCFSIPNITFNKLLTGFLLLTLPQIPLSLGNSIFATNQLIKDYFPKKKVSIKKIALTYSIMNIIAPFLGGIPVCHGSGGIAGHYTFGGRTGGSTLIYGFFYLLLGLFFSIQPINIFNIFPKPILGVILLFEGIALISLIKDIVIDKKNFFIAIIVGILANGVKYGFLIGLIAGILLYYLFFKLPTNKIEKRDTKNFL